MPRRTPVDHPTTADVASVRAVAAGFGLLCERDLLTLCGISAKTAAAWRKAKAGPPAVRLGNAWHYDRLATQAWIARRFAEREVKP